ncbi:toll/interleukin-1 receptor domain-containing protein [Candidatus Methylospira mobilis]|uniref:toll/interleukin-1 receptor domain-containing protein n=1 Tax=Candidatus Methylospira mobilis TaxID=1808979 RepID=UPI001884ADE8|nr:toll/interleukin-1 receptor domain-containing protein [Candidatus Methylospira mobilis]WNV03998.1 toll/interleukin-1 receptor domain-containing protein [Candidatus Methylospira mobilis]
MLELLDGIHANRPPDRVSPSPLRIFISYSHAQRDYFHVFKTDLGQYIQLPDVEVQVFDDNAIPIGAAWDEYLQGKVSDCDVMVLLVSQEFMNSQYIREKEFGSALERWEQTVDCADLFCVLPVRIGRRVVPPAIFQAAWRSVRRGAKG